VVAKAQDKHHGLVQVEEHVFQFFKMFASSFLLQGEYVIEIYNTK
jgi:hypothetical protein